MRKLVMFIAIISNSLFASQEENFKEFIDICENKDQLSEAYQNTLDSMFFVHNTKDCGELYKSLESASKINLSHHFIEDLTLLRYFPQVKNLNISGTNVSNLSFLENLPLLEVLHMYSTQITSVEDTANCKNLVEIDIFDTQVTDVSVFGELKKLRKVDISSTKVEDIGFVKNSDIEILYLSGCPVSDFAPLQGGKKLKRIDVYDTSFQQMHMIKKWPHLENLWVGGEDSPIDKKLQKELRSKKFRRKFNAPFSFLIPLL